MRIAYLTQTCPPLPGAAALLASQLAEAMGACGHQVLVITTSDKDYLYHTYTENLTVVRLSSINDPTHTGERLFSHPRRAIFIALNHFQPDVIQTYTSIQTGTAALAYAKRARVPIILTAHQIPSFRSPYLLSPVIEKIYWWYAGTFLRQYTVILVPTQAMENLMTRMTRCKTVLINGGPDPSAIPETFEKYERMYHKLITGSG